MWGAVVGDIAGSMYEFNPIKTKSFEMFQSPCDYTDDTVCTAAISDILLHNLPAAETLREWCRRHPGRGYGSMFTQWIDKSNKKSYGSCGNGAAMRISPVALHYRTHALEDALMASDRLTEITHDHAEGIKGARATVHATWLALHDEDPATIRHIIEKTYHYDLSRTVEEIRPDYYFSEICQKTVPEAIVCALESESYRDALRNAISLGGDADTLAAIAGPIAEALHEIPYKMVKDIERSVLREENDIKEVIAELYERSYCYGRYSKM